MDNGYNGESAWWWYSSLKPYLLLLHLFRDGRLFPQELAAIYIRLFKSDEVTRDEELFQHLNGIFTALDSYRPDNDLSRFEIGLEELSGIVFRGLDEIEVWLRIRFSQDVDS